MNRVDLIAFDDHIQCRSDETYAVAYSSDKLALVLALFDQIAFTANAEQISGADPVLGVTLQHSPDGMNWLDVDDASVGQDLDPANTNVLVGFSSGFNPLLRFARFKVEAQVSSGPMNIAVRIDTVLNDVRESKFAAKMRKLIKKSDDANQCVQMIQGGTLVDESSLGYAAVKQAADASGFGSLATPVGPLKDELVAQRDGGIRVALDARICVTADGHAILTSPRTQLDLHTATATGSSGDASEC